MSKNKLILLSLIFAFICTISSFCFASDSIKGATDVVVNGINNVGNSVRSGITTTENNIEGAVKMNRATADSSVTTLNNGMNNYATTRTAATTTITNSTTIWIWMIVAIAAIVIIGLVWYYASQNNVHHE